MDLSIIIVNYNVKYFLEHCLASVQKAIGNLHVEVFVVDNASNDGSKAFFNNRFPFVHFIYNDKNLGFAKANNIAFAKSKGKYVLFLNPDTLVPEDCFSKCIAFFESNSNCGAIGVKMIDGAGNFLKESKRSFPAPVTSFYKLSGLAKLFPKSKTFSNYHLGHLNENETNEVDVLAGAFMMAPKSVLDKVGSFDEQFFMYGEDVDLSYRIQKAGYKNYYLADPTIIHFKGESTKRGSLNYVKMFYKAMSQFVTKHYGNAKAGVFQLFIQLAIIVRASISGFGKFIKWIGLPLIDALIVIFCIWATKLFWFAYIKPEIRYNREIVVSASVLYTILYIISSFFSGLYDKPFLQKNLNRSAIVSTVILLACYGLLPEHFRFSRGIIFGSALVSFFTLSLFRFILIKLEIVETYNEVDNEKQTIILSNEKDKISIQNILAKAGLEDKVLGFVSSTVNEKSLGEYENFSSIQKSIPFKEIIYSASSISYKDIITNIETYKNKYISKFYFENNISIIGSESKNTIGESITHFGKFKITSSASTRCKRIVDVSSSFFLILLSPVLYWFSNKKKHYFTYLLEIILNKKTFVGYCMAHIDLPKLKEGKIKCNGFGIDNVNTLSNQLLFQIDYRYAKHYNCFEDFKIIWGYYFGK